MGTVWFEEIRGKFVSPHVHSSREHLLVVEAPDDDDGETITIGEIEPISGLAIIISYRDSKGQASDRLITCQRLDVRSGISYISAFCHSRRAVRSFRVDRIVELFDHQSGESLNPVETFLAQFAPNEVHASGYGWGLHPRKRADLIAFLNALVFIARCDRDYHPLEREVLEGLICRFWLRLEILDEPDLPSILNFADRLAPDAETFWVSLHRIKESEKLASFFRRSAGELIAADAHVADQEMYWGGKIDDFFLRT